MSGRNRGLSGVVAGAVCCVVVGVGVLGGCAPYVTYPASEADRGGVGDVNLEPSMTVQRLAVGRVLAMDLGSGVLPMRGVASQAEGLWVLNPAGGTTLVRAQRMRRSIDVAGRGLLVGEPGSESAPVYSVTRVWVRGDSARVDVVRPVEDDRFERVTVRLRAGSRPWRVESVYEWPGAVDEPELFGWPETVAGEGEEAAGATDEGGA